MAADNNIVIVTNKSNVGQMLKDRLVLLRVIDHIAILDYVTALHKTKIALPDTILLHCSAEKDDCLKLVKEFKSNEITKTIEILLVVDKYEQDFVLSAYDSGISDFFVLGNDNAEILMRTIWSLKKNTLLNTVNKYNSLLKKLKVLNQESGFFATEFSETVFENEFKLLRDREADGMLMLVSPSDESKGTISQEQLAETIKRSTRTSDVVVHSPGNRFFILLPKTPLKGAFCVWEKIKKVIGDENAVKAGLTSISNKSYKSIKNELLKALLEAESTKSDIIVVNNEEEELTSDSWIDKMNSPQKNFKLFKQSFNKKLEKVIAPVFFQIQEAYEGKLFNTQIEQYTNETDSEFILRAGANESQLKITYPGFSKINIDIIYRGLESPENKRITLDLSELDEGRLSEIVENFIEEFKSFNSDK